MIFFATDFSEKSSVKIGIGSEQSSKAWNKHIET